jgi:DNA-directed RNA polymerase specialized sigma24 family protein
LVETKASFLLSFVERFTLLSFWVAVSEKQKLKNLRRKIMIRIKIKDTQIEVTEQFAKEYETLDITVQRGQWVYDKHNTSLNAFEWEDAKYFTDKKSNIEEQYISDTTADEYLSVLTERERYVVRKIVFEGWPAKDLAISEGKSQQAVSKTFKTAKAKMREYIMNNQ